MKFRLNKYQKKLRYELSPYRKVYDNFEMDWLPSLMFLNKRNFRSKVCNTDIHGLRFNHRVNFKKTSIFNIKKNKNSLLVGASAAFGIGASKDKTTISSILSNKKEHFYNVSGRAYNMFQEITLFLSIFYKINKINKIIIFSGINDVFLFSNKAIYNNFPGPIFWNNQFVNQMNKISRTSSSDFKSIFNVMNENKTNEYLKIDLKETIMRNFYIWKLIKKSLKVKVYFVLQPYLKWGKKYSIEEKKIVEYINLRHDKDIYYNVARSYKNVKKLFMEAARVNKINFLDSNDYIKKKYSSKDFLFIDNFHLNDKGNKAIADFIKQKIR